MISKILDVLAATLMLALIVMLFGMAYQFFTSPTRQAIRCEGLGLNYGPKLDLDDDMALALINVCKARDAASGGGGRK